MEARLDWIDYAKGIGIILVVYGHVLRGIYNAEMHLSEIFYNVSDSLVYGFHMPLFFFLSGFFFTKCLNKRGTTSFLADKAKALLYPYIVWMLFQSGMELVLSNYTNNHLTMTEVFSMLYAPRAQFWFLHTLFLMYLGTTAIFLASGKLGTIFSLILSAFLLFFPQAIGIALLGPFATNYVFFVLGVICFKLGLERWQLPSTPVAMLSTGAAFAALGILTVSGNLMAPAINQLLLAISGIVFVLTIAAGMSKSHKLKILKTIGQKTMPIYLAHIIAGSGVRIMLDRLFHFHNVFAHVVVGTLAGIVLPLLVYRIAKRNGLLFMFEFPGRSRGVRVGEAGLQLSS